MGVRQPPGIRQAGFYIAIVHDISNRHESRSGTRNKSAVFECSAEAIVITDTLGHGHRHQSGLQPDPPLFREQVIGRKPSLCKSGSCTTGSFYRAMWTSIVDAGRWRGSHQPVEVWWFFPLSLSLFLFLTSGPSSPRTVSLGLPVASHRAPSGTRPGLAPRGGVAVIGRGLDR